MTELSLGVIGCGIIGRHHLAAARRCGSVKVAAVADIREETAREAAGLHQVPRWTSRPAELIEDESIDALILALPTAVRFPLARDALGAGKHILLEKPAAMSAEELEALAAWAKPGQVVACASSRFRAMPAGRAAARILGEDPVGPLRLIQVRAVVPASSPPAQAPPAWRLNRALNGGGILVNWGVYDLDFLLGSLGWSLCSAQVSAAVWRVPPPVRAWVAAGSDAETHAKAFVRFTNDVVLDYERAELYGGKAEAVWRLTGERGTIELPMLGGQGAAITLWELTSRGLAERTLWTQPDPNPDVHAGPVFDFVEAIQERRAPLTDLGQATAVTRLTDQIYRLAETGLPQQAEQLIPASF